VKSSDVDTRKPYQAPKLVALGSLHQATLASPHHHTKVGAHCDVTCFHHGSG